MNLLIQYTLIYASALFLAALGGCSSEHSGVINLGLEGVMVMGALGGALVLRYMPALPPALLVVMVMLGSMLFGLLFSLLLAVAAIILLRGRLRFAACMAFCLALGAFSGQTAWHPALPAEGEYQVRGIVSDTIRRGNFGQVRVFLSDVSLNDRPLSSGAYWTFYIHDDEEDTFLEGLEPGKEVSFRATLYHPSGAVNPEGYDFHLFGIC